MNRSRRGGLSVRWRLTLSYAGFLLLAGLLLLAIVWVFLLRYIPDREIGVNWGFVPNRSNLLDAFLPAAMCAVGFLAFFGLVGGWILAGRMLAPLTKITDATRLAAQGTLSHRIRLDGRDDEFRELADAFDAMLARIEAHVAEQQRFAANASHELRTPLAITQTLLDVARNDPDRNVSEVLARLHHINSRAIGLTDALLILSRADNTPIENTAVDLSLIAEEAAETLLPLAEKRGIALDVSGTLAHTTGSSSLLLQAVTNLVHNALVHNLPTGGSVWVTATERAGTVTLVVDNTGADLSLQQVGTFIEPFQRSSQRIHSSDHVGAGLGLAIVDRIIRAHHGRVDLRPREGGGLRIRIDLPALEHTATNDYRRVPPAPARPLSYSEKGRGERA